ncbi:MFS transporter [Plantactinospora sp. KBS50]|uniref:MFS transporter n=1 Tax=Plantactinospora sp. KBS50 TaxID=2024580 RepID=UPI000BAB046B|nr:MFS transporter [Plantactinospora sp. KBS50]ASW55387.1 MFS transporter [Plantactinospora sp. KBS50]
MTTSAATRDPAVPLTDRQRRAVVAGSIGNTVEWVDWAVYASFAPIFATQFFPSGDPKADLLATLAVFAVGFVMRPIGGALLGSYADRHGRKAGLTLTISLMAGASLVIAICPPYSVIGILAPLVLVLARLVQGFSAGGEFGTSSAFLVESAAPGRRAFVGSWQQVSVGAGGLIASLLGVLLTRTLTDDALSSWGWRVAFGVGGLLGLVGLWLRLSVEETEAFTGLAERRADRPKPRPLRDMLVNHPGAALRVVGITIAGTLLYYMWISYMPGYAHTAEGVPLSEAFLANSLAIAIFLVLLPFGGKLSDRFGRKPTLLAFAIGFLLLAWPAFHFIGGGFWPLFLVELAGVVFMVGYSANCAAVMAEQFPAEVRTTGIGLPYALAVALFGGTAPYLTTWLASSGHRDLVWMYAAAAAVVGIVVYATMPETRGRELE